jgi:hypothetical protein
MVRAGSVPSAPKLFPVKAGLDPHLTLPGLPMNAATFTNRLSPKAACG